MFRHNLILIYRNFKRFKGTFFINLIGLTSGLACTLFIYLWVNDELSVDKFHENDHRLFMVMERQQHTGSVRTTPSTPGLLAEALKEEMPEIEYSTVATPTYWMSGVNLSNKDYAVKASGKFAGQDYFNIFSYPLIEGDESNVLSDKNSIVISDVLAEKLFTTSNDVIGKAVTIQHDQSYLVSGVFKAHSSNSTEWFDFVLSFEVMKEIEPGMLDWGNSGPDTFVVLRDGVSLNQFNQKIADFIQSKSEDTHRELFLTSYSENYLYGDYDNGVQAGGRIEYVRLFSVIAMLVLIIACINFMNLTTAKASRRLKEVGVKKAIGAGRKTLVGQYLGESLLISLLSLLLALILVGILLEPFNTITGKQLTLNIDAQFISVLLGIALFTGFVAGSYPALYLSSFKPAAILKGKINGSVGELLARKGLVIFQFTISIILIVSVLVVYKQIQFVQTKNIGFEKDNIIYFEREGKLLENLETFLAEVKNMPGILNASSAMVSMVGGGNTTSSIHWEGKDPNNITPFATRPINYDIIEMLGIELVKGRSFSKDFATDSTNIIFNQSAIQVMGLTDPIGKVINLWGNNYQIIGVVKNFHFQSLHESVDPLFFILAPNETEKIMVKIAAGKEVETIRQLGKFYQAYNPGFPFNYQFLDQDYQAQYVAEIRVGILSRYFAGIAILISCLGLFGLATFTVERRLKEIGIRKILGSGALGIVRLLSVDFTRMVFAAIVVALPISYLIATNWLNDFAYRIDLEWWFFIGPGLTALLIAWVTVSAQTVKAAWINPVDCISDE